MRAFSQHRGWACFYSRHLWKCLLILQLLQLQPQRSSPRDTPHLAFVSPSRVHLTSRNGEGNYCSSSKLCCGGSSAAGSPACSLPGVPPAHTRRVLGIVHRQRSPPIPFRNSSFQSTELHTSNRGRSLPKSPASLKSLSSSSARPNRFH